MELDRSNYREEGSGWADTRLGGESIAVKLDDHGQIQAAMSDDLAFNGRPVGPHNVWLSEFERQSTQ